MNCSVHAHSLRSEGWQSGCAGLEIRIQDFGLNWTGLAPSVLVFDEFTFFIRVNWTGVVASALNFFERVTFAGYSPTTFAYAYIWPICVQVALPAFYRCGRGSKEVLLHRGHRPVASSGTARVKCFTYRQSLHIQPIERCSPAS